MDDRIPLILDGMPQADDAVLLPQGWDLPRPAVVVRHLAVPVPRHLAGCACCTPRHAVAQALGALSLARARGDVAWFSRVVVLGPPQMLQAAREAAQSDRLVAARLRLV